MAQATQTQETTGKMPFIPTNIRKPVRHPAAASLPPDLDVDPNAPPVATPPQAAQATSNNTHPVVSDKKEDIKTTQWDVGMWQRQQEELARQMAAQRQEFSAQLEASKQQLAEAQKRIAEFEAAQAQAALDAQVNDLTNIEIGELEYLDSDAANELKEKILVPLVKRTVAATEARLAQVNSLASSALDASNSNMTKWKEEQERSNRARINSAIMERHPDVEQIIKTPEYLAFMSQVIPGTLVTYGSQIEAAYNSGNTDYVNELLDRYKQGGASLQSIATPPVNPVASTPTVSAGNTYTYADLDEQIHKLNRREITPAQYKQFLDDFSKAEAEGRVA